MKKFILFVLILCISAAALTSCFPLNLLSENKASEFHDLVTETQVLLDEYADDIYTCWYNYVYENEYSSVDDALLDAILMNSDNISNIKAKNEEITELYKNVRDGAQKDEVKAVMQAYNEYYSFVMEPSGSFTTYSANKEPLKKALSTALKNLSSEL